MTRRTIGLLITFALTLLLGPLTAEAQPPTKVPWIGSTLATISVTSMAS
jgi:hypothetical protein